ncbi:MAG: carboxypeptidase [Oscillospiraceae bacterium]|nr:carboxypeptidase [Oscillospiraceae bacterium]
MAIFDKEKNSVRPRGTDSAKIIPVIVTESLRGMGTEYDTVRTVKQYWSLEGEMLAENDPG